MIVAITALSVMFVLRTGMSIIALIAGTASPMLLVLTTVLSALILIGMCKGHRLAWQWGRILGLLGAILLLMITLTALASMGIRTIGEFVVVTMAVGVPAAALFTMFFSIGTHSARRYFGLVCPSCGSMKCKAADFFFTKARCATCGSEWGNIQVVAPSTTGKEQ